MKAAPIPGVPASRWAIEGVVQHVPLLQEAYGLQRAGRPEEAARLCAAILRADPRQFDALLLLASLNSQKGEYERALERLEEALAVDPESLPAAYNRACLLHILGRFEAALAAFDGILARNRDFGETLNNRGVVLSALNRHAEALASFDEAVKLNPRAAKAFSNRGNALLAMGHREEALASFDRAIALEPRYAEAHYNRAVALMEMGHLNDALAGFDACITHDPGHADAWEHRATVLTRLLRFSDAVTSLDRVLALRPGDARTYYLRANALSVLKRFEEAVSDAGKALSRDPDYPYARGVLVHSKLSCCDWRGLDEEADKIETALHAGKRVLSPFEYLALSPSAELQLHCAEIWAADTCPAAAPLWRGEHYRHDRIRLAYLSADFRNHPVAFLMAGVFEAHDRARFETFAISFTPEHQSPMRRRLEHAFDHFTEVRGKSDLEIAKAMRKHEIDVAVDLMGFTRECRTGILAFRPAPVQVNYLGYPGTMGTRYIDYIVADRLIIPPEHRRHYSEKIVYLPDSYLPNDTKRPAAGKAPARRQAGLPEKGFVFASFNGTYKFAPQIFDIWMRLLRTVDGSVLWLPQSEAAAMGNIRREAEARGVAPGRIVFAPYVDNAEEHLARLTLADLFLDTSPYGAHTSASDALWAGVPVLTLAGETFAGRVAASLLNAAGLPELITDSPKAYEAAALRLVREPDALAALRAKLTRSRVESPVFEMQRFVRHLETAYTVMWTRSQRGEPPDEIVVEPE